MTEESYNLSLTLWSYEWFNDESTASSGSKDNVCWTESFVYEMDDILDLEPSVFSFD